MIKIENVCKTIGNKPILKNVSLDIKDGEIFCLVGPNGAGKTTLVRLILNLYNPTSGTIIVNNCNVIFESYEDVKKEIGLLLDNIGLFKNMTAWQNIEFFHRIYNLNSDSSSRKSRIEQLLSLVGLSEYSEKNPTFFSRGMKQRLCLARALVGNPKLIILDEPLRGMDLDGQILIRDILNKLKNNGCTIYINSHNMAEVERIATHIAFIKNGEIVDDGNIEDLLNKHHMDSLEELYIKIIGVRGGKNDSLPL